VNEDIEQSATYDPRLRTRNRAILVGLMVLGMLPLIAAVWLYYGNPGSVTGAQTNRGALLQPPAQLPELALRDEGGLVTAEGPRLWRIVLFAPTACGEPCLERMHLLRQVHVLLGREEDRVIRLAAFDGEPDAALHSAMLEYFPDQEIVRARPGTLAEVLGTRALVGGDALDPALVEAGGPWPEEGILIVDPLGNVIFFHGLDQIGDALLFDLKRLLRLSNIG
jgi:hypothetical protein